MDIRNPRFNHNEFFYGPPITDNPEKIQGLLEFSEQSEKENVLKQVEEELGISLKDVSLAAKRALIEFFVSDRFHFDMLKNTIVNFEATDKISALNVFLLAESDPIFSTYLEYIARGAGRDLSLEFFRTHEVYLADVPAQAEEIRQQLAATFSELPLSGSEIEEILRFRVKENIANLIKRMDYGEYGSEIYNDVIQELKDVPAQEQLAVYLFKIIAKILEQKNVELEEFRNFQQVVLDRLNSENQSGIFNKTLERLGHLKMIPEIHWRVDRTSEEYNRRLGLDINGYLLERAIGSKTKEVLLEIGSGSGVAKKERAALGLASSYEDYALTNEVYFSLASIIEKLVDFEKLEAGLNIKLSHGDRKLLADFLYKSFVIKAGQGGRDDFEYDDAFRMQMSYGINYLRYDFPHEQQKLALADTVPQTISSRNSQGQVVYPNKIKADEQSPAFQAALNAIKRDFLAYLVKDWQTMDYYALVEIFPPNTIVADMSNIDRLKVGQVGVEIGSRSTVYKQGSEYVEFLQKLEETLKDGGVAIDDSIRDNDGWYYRIAEVMEAKKQMDPTTEILVVLGEGFEKEDFRKDGVPLSMVMTKKGSSQRQIQSHLQPGCRLVTLEQLAADQGYLKTLDKTGRTAKRAKEATTQFANAA